MDAAELREHCLSFSGSVETTPFGPETTVFKVAGKIFALSRLNSPEFCLNSPPSQSRGCREGRAPDAPVGPVCGSTRASHVPKHTGNNYRYSRDIPAFPAQWFYGLYVLSPVSGLYCHRCPASTGRQGWTPGSRRQDHTISPAAAVVSPGEEIT